MGATTAVQPFIDAERRRQASIPSGGTWAFLGDSITNAVVPYAMGSGEYHAIAARLSGGRIQWLRKFGEAGMGLFVTGNSGKVWEVAVADVLAHPVRPNVVYIAIGTNDVARTETMAQMLAKIDSAAQAFRAVGCDIALGTIPARTSSSVAQKLWMLRWNTSLRRYAHLHNYFLVDMYAATVATDGTGNYATGYSDDGVHPNVTGATAMANAMVAALDARQTGRAVLPMDNTALSSAYVLDNPLLLTDAITDGPWNQAPSDGIADFWGKAATAAGATVELITDAAVVGNVQHVKRNGESGTTNHMSKRVSAVAGDLISVSMRLKITNDTGSSGAVTLVNCTPYAGTALGSASQSVLVAFSYMGAGAQSASFGWTTVQAECLVTDAATTNVGLNVYTQIPAVQTCEVWWGQVRLMNLTQLGIA